LSNQPQTINEETQSICVSSLAHALFHCSQIGDKLHQIASAYTLPVVAIALLKNGLIIIGSKTAANSEGQVTVITGSPGCTIAKSGTALIVNGIYHQLSTTFCHISASKKPTPPFFH
jgi:hypothetical protein